MGNCRSICCAKDEIILQIQENNVKYDSPISKANEEDDIVIDNEIGKNPHTEFTPQKFNEEHKGGETIQQAIILKQEGSNKSQNEICSSQPSRKSDSKKQITGSNCALVLHYENHPLVRTTLNKEERVKLGVMFHQFNFCKLISIDSGASYEGEWKNCLRDGYGKQTWPDGSTYEGNWVNDKSHGKGKLVHADGDIYEGDWIEDKAFGQGIYQHINGARYEGDWKNDKQNGKGIESWPDGAQYKGDYVDGKKNGKGCLNFADGSIYEGDFFQNDIHGYGVYSWPDQRQYSGTWKLNKMHGRGEIIWSDGRKYTGVMIWIIPQFQEYYEDKKHGNGVFYWPDNRKYIGKWHNGKQHGIGIYFLGNNEAKVGEWCEGRRIKWFDQSEVNHLRETGQLPVTTDFVLLP